MRKSLAAGVLVAVAATAHAADRTAAGTDLDAKLGYDETAGKYGALSKTTLRTTSIGVTYDTDGYGLDLVVPYLEEKGPGRVIFLPGRRPVVLIGPERKASGEGDITVGLTRYVLTQETRGVDLDLGAIVKVGTASAAKGLGSGKNDVSVQAALARPLGPFQLTATGGYTFVGKSPELDLRNSAYGSLDASANWRAFSAGLTYDVGQTSSRTTTGSRDLTAYVSWKLAHWLSIEIYGLKGYTTESPDHGFGITVTASP